MSTDAHIDVFGQPAIHTLCSNCYASVHGNNGASVDDQHGIGASNDQIDSALSLSWNQWDLAAPSSDFTNADGNHCDAVSFVTCPSYNASSNQAFGGILDATATPDQYISIWSPNLLPSNHGFQQQALSITNNGWNGRSPDVSVTLPAWHTASQTLSPMIASFDQSVIPTSSLVGYGYPPAHSNAIANGLPDPTLTLAGFGGYDDFGVMSNGFTNFDSLDDLTAINPQENMTNFNQLPLPTTTSILAASELSTHDSGVVSNGFPNVNSFTQWDDLTAIDPQLTITNSNQLPLPTTTSMSPAHALPTPATNMSTTPMGSGPIAGSAASRRSNINTNPYHCPECGKFIARRGDLDRHRKMHGVPQYPCVVHGCSKAFYRTDKLRDHQRNKHEKDN